ncbi:MAG: hypothetical protein M3Z33_00110, partial [Actinomycetota bacterium]|nr:hypothetical protein [Actinomycetota bacterium]
MRALQNADEKLAVASVDSGNLTMPGAQVIAFPAMDAVNSSTQKMFAAYQGGATLVQTGKRFGLSGERVRQIFHTAGLSVRSPREARELRREQAIERERAMMARLRECGNVKLVAEDFGV